MRQWIYDVLRTSLAMQGLLGNPPAIFEGGALTKVPEVDQFLVIRFGAEAPELDGDDDLDELPQNSNVQLWAHDRGGDYLVIDKILKTARRVLSGATMPANGFNCRWVEGSRDFKDPDFNTLTKYSRYVLIHT